MLNAINDQAQTKEIENKKGIEAPENLTKGNNIEKTTEMTNMNESTLLQHVDVEGRNATNEMI